MPHIHELNDFVIAAFIVHNDKVLLVDHPKYNLWLPIGGHIELDETPDQALYREIEEECGLTVTVLTKKEGVDEGIAQPLLVPNYMYIHDAGAAPHRHIVLAYYCVADSAEARLSDEHTSLRWFSEHELDDPVFTLGEATKHCCRQALAAARTLT